MAMANIRMDIFHGTVNIRDGHGYGQYPRGRLRIADIPLRRHGHGYGQYGPPLVTGRQSANTGRESIRGFTLALSKMLGTIFGIALPKQQPDAAARIQEPTNIFALNTLNLHDPRNLAYLVPSSLAYLLLHFSMENLQSRAPLQSKAIGSSFKLVNTKPQATASQ